ncbi:hypothetical protein MOUN0_F05886 [Monosporozyma unispora]
MLFSFKILNIIKYSILWFTFIINATNAVTIDKNEIMLDSTWVTSPLSISKGAGLVILNGLIHFFSNDVTNNGNLFVCQNETSLLAFGMTYVTFGNVFNYGTYILDDSLANTGANVAFSGDTFYNEGAFYINTKANSLFTSSQTISATNFVNKGLMWFTQSVKNGGGTLSLGGSSSNSITNNGTICVTNNAFTQGATIVGSGCMTIGDGASFTISRDTGGQTFYLAAASASFTILSVIKNPPIVMGLQSGSTIVFPFAPSSINYNTATGILSASSLLPGQTQNVYVGTGLKSSDFALTSWFSSTVKYSGATAPRPAVCTPCGTFPVCDVPKNQTYSSVSNIFASSVSFDTAISSSSIASSSSSSLIITSSSTSSSSSSVTSSLNAVTSVATGTDSLGFKTSDTKLLSQSTISDSLSSIVHWNDTSTKSSSISIPTPYTTTITSDGTSETAVVSPVTSIGEDGKPTTGVTTLVLGGSSSSRITVHGASSSAPVTVPVTAPYTTTITSDGTSETAVVSPVTTTDEDGKPTTSLVTSYLGGSSSAPVTVPISAPYTTTITSDGTSRTAVVSPVTSIGEDGKPTTSLVTNYLGASSSAPVTVPVTAPYTTTITSDGTSETAVVSPVTSIGEDGKPTTGVTTIALGGSSSSRISLHGSSSSAPVTVPVTAPYTTTITSDGTSRTAVVSPVTSIGEDGKPTTGLTTIALGGSSSSRISLHGSSSSAPVTVPVTAPYTTTITSDGTSRTAVVSPVTSIGEDGKPTTGLTTIALGGSSSSRISLHGSSSSAPVTVPVTAPYTTTITSDGTSRTAVVSPVTTTDEDGKPTTSLVTSYLGGSSSAPVTVPVTAPYTTTITSDGTSRTAVVSPVTSIGEDGKPTTGLTTIALGGSSSSRISLHGSSSSAPVTVPVTAPYTTTITSDGTSRTAVVSPVTSIGEDGKPTTGLTTIALGGSSSSRISLHGSSSSAPVTVPVTAPYTTTITSDGTSRTAVVSPVTSIGEDGKPTTSLVTNYLGASSSAPVTVPITAPYTTTITSDGTSETAVVSPITSIGEDGKPTTSLVTNYLGASSSAPVTVPVTAPYTTTITSDGTSETAVVSPVTSIGEDGKPTTSLVTNYLGASSSAPVTVPITAPYTTTITSDGTSETAVVSPITSIGEDGKPTTSLVTNYLGASSSAPVTVPVTAPYTTTITSDGTSETAVVSPITSIGEDGKPTTGVTTIVLGGSSSSRISLHGSSSSGPVTVPITAPYTTTITSDGTSETAVVSPVTSIGEDGKPTTGLTTIVLGGSSSSRITVHGASSSAPVTVPVTAPYTTTITSDGTSETAVVSPVTTTDEDGKPTTSLVTSYLGGSSSAPVTVPISAPYTTTITSDGTSRTAVVSPVTSIGEDGKPTTSLVTNYLGASSSAPVTVPVTAPYTTTITSDGTSETAVVSPVTSIGEDGKPTTSLVTNYLGASSSAPVTVPITAPYTTTITSDGTSETAVVSPITSIGEDGKPTTGVTTIVLGGSSSSRISLHGSSSSGPVTVPITAPYTTTITTDGTSETAVVSPVTSIGEDGKPTTGLTTIVLGGSSSAPVTAPATAPHTTTITSDGTTRTAEVSPVVTTGADGKPTTSQSTSFLGTSAPATASHTTTITSDGTTRTAVVSPVVTTGVDGKPITGITTKLAGSSMLATYKIPKSGHSSEGSRTTLKPGSMFEGAGVRSVRYQGIGTLILLLLAQI